MDLALNNLQSLIRHKTKQTKPNNKYVHNLLIVLIKSYVSLKQIYLYSVIFYVKSKKKKSNILKIVFNFQTLRTDDVDGR